MIPKQTKAKMNTNNNNAISMFFPYLKASVDVDQIIAILNGFHQLGVVGKIDLVARTDKKTGAKYNMAYVHMIEWNMETPYVQQFLCELRLPNHPNKLFINDREYWTVIENKYEEKKLTNAPRKAPRPTAEVAAPPAPMALNFADDDGTCDLVDATYVWQIETELARMKQRVTELESQIASVSVSVA